MFFLFLGEVLIIFDFPKKNIDFILWIGMMRAVWVPLGNSNFHLNLTITKERSDEADN